MALEKRVFKAVYREYEKDPLPSRSENGRFHDRTRGKWTTYLASSAETAWREVLHRWRARPESYRIVEVAVRLSKVVDFTEPENQRKYGITPELLMGGAYTPCQKLARQLREEGVEGFWTYSRVDRPSGRTLVVFLDQLLGGSVVKVQRVRPVGLPGL
ncbi:MAG: RES family NAD+ phosphorylase [Deltaproteobacteria bacterium]|nr:RES family NAD+ phosphorylase [Deltaproteobacteria bacterium]